MMTDPQQPGGGTGVSGAPAQATSASPAAPAVPTTLAPPDSPGVPRATSVPPDSPGVPQATSGPSDSPGVPVTPLFIYLFFMAVAVGLEQLLRLPLPRGTGWVLGGGVLLGAGLVLIAWTMVEFGLAHVNPEPSRPTSALILRGPFRLSRNPTYLGGLLAAVGGGLLGGSGWVLVFALPLAALMHAYVIPREERYLERTFGDEYRAYAAHVRRWI